MSDKTLDDVEQMLQDQQSLIEPIVMECIKEIFHHIPKDHVFILSNGKEASIKTFYEPRVNKNTRQFEFGIDVRIKDFPVDHIEFCMRKTGQGGFV